MDAINPIIEGCPSKQLTEVPQYVLDTRQELATRMNGKIKRIKIPKTKISKQKTMTHKKISRKAFNSFINTGYPKPAESAPKVTRSTPINKMGDCAIQEFRNLIELAKAASRDQDLAMADLFYELKEMKEKEIALIHNYIKKYR